MHNVNFQPQRMQSVTPYLLVDNVQLLIDFAESVFGAQLDYKLDRPDGKIMHAEILLGDSRIMAGEPMGAFEAFPCALYVYVENCDAVYAKAIAYGCQDIMKPTTMTHAGERYGGVKDSNGNLWWIATHMEDVTPDEQRKRIAEMKEKWSEPD